MLYNTPDRHPIVFLRDVRFHEIKALLEFMYRGEVSVDQENLSSLLKVAEGLKIKGLAEVSDGSGGGQHSPPAAAASAAAAQAAANALTRMPILPPGHPLLGNSLAQSQSHLSHSPTKRMGSPPSASTSSTSGLPKRKRIKPRRLSGSEAVPLASGLAQAVEVARSQQLAKEQAEAAAAAIAAVNAAAAVEASIKKDLDGSESTAAAAMAMAMDARGGGEEESSLNTKLDGVRSSVGGNKTAYCCHHRTK